MEQKYGIWIITKRWKKDFHRHLCFDFSLDVAIFSVIAVDSWEKNQIIFVLKKNKLRKSSSVIRQKGAYQWLRNVCFSENLAHLLPPF